MHTVENFVKMGVELEKMGCDSLGIKDMSGIIQPRIAFDLVKELKRKIGIPITLHTHDTAGLGASSYLAAIDAGVDCVEVVDCALCQRHLAAGHATDVGAAGRPSALPAIRHGKAGASCATISKVFTRNWPKFTSPANERVDSDILIYQVPGGMLSNFRTQLKEQGMSGAL